MSAFACRITNRVRKFAGSSISRTPDVRSDPVREIRALIQLISLQAFSNSSGGVRSVDCLIGSQFPVVLRTAGVPSQPVPPRHSTDVFRDLNTMDMKFTSSQYALIPQACMVCNHLKDQQVMPYFRFPQTKGPQSRQPLQRQVTGSMGGRSSFETCRGRICGRLPSPVVLQTRKPHIAWVCRRVKVVRVNAILSAGAFDASRLLRTAANGLLQKCQVSLGRPAHLAGLAPDVMEVLLVPVQPQCLVWWLKVQCTFRGIMHAQHGSSRLLSQPLLGMHQRTAQESVSSWDPSARQCILPANAGESVMPSVHLKA